jgi:hypothetical protein
MRSRADIKKEERRLGLAFDISIIIFIIQILLLINIGHSVSDTGFLRELFEKLFELYSSFGIRDSFFLGSSVILVIALSVISFFISICLIDSLQKKK